MRNESVKLQNLCRMGIRLNILLKSGTFRKWNVKKLTWEEDTEPYALARDQKIRYIAQVGVLYLFN
jgi:hypothetical protein